LNQNVVTSVYDVRDLLIDVPNYQVQDIAQTLNALNTGGGGIMAGSQGGGGQTTNLNLSSSSGGTQVQQRTSKDLLDEIMKLMTDNVAPESWRGNGGTIGAISELLSSGQLVVLQTPENQRKIEDLLDKIREKRDIMVTVEARFLTVDRDFLEAVGLNLGATFNLNRSPNSVFSNVPVTFANSSFTDGITTGVPGAITAPSGSSSSGASTGGSLQASASSIAFTYLDDFEVNFMLTAAEATNNDSLVTAPRVTVFDGGSAVIGVNTLVYYVSNLEPVIGTGAVGFTATIGEIPTGITLFVRAVVSADRKYVTLQMQPILTNLLSLVTFQFTSASTAIVGGAATVTNNSVSEFLELPTVQVTSVETLVSVPDGGTLLMGGETIAGEAQRENGTPVLSQIPFLRRLFTNESQAKDEEVLLILVKPTILIQREQENKQFPLLSSKVTGE